MASAKLNKKKNIFIIFLIRLFREKPIGAAGLLIVILFFALYLGIFPAGGYLEIFHGWNSFLYLFLPILVLVSQQVSVLVRFLRSNVLDVINSDYIMNHTKV